MIGYRNKKKTKVLKPWITSFILKYQASVVGNRAEVVKITNSIGGSKKGEHLKHVTDGEVYIKARFLETAVAQFLAGIDDESQTDWSSSMIILQQYRLKLETRATLAECQYVLEIEKFKLWDLQEGFSRKSDDLLFCMDNNEVKMKALQEWNKWRDENQQGTKRDDSEVPSLRDDSCSVPLSQLLAEMACPSQENTTEQPVEDSQPLNQDHSFLPDSLLKKLYSSFTLEEFEIDNKQLASLKEIAEWKVDYRPTPSVESSGENGMSQPQLEISSVNTLADDKFTRIIPAAHKEKDTDLRKTDVVLTVQENQNKKQEERKPSSISENIHTHLSVAKRALAEKILSRNQKQQKPESQQSQSSEYQQTKYSQADSSLWQQDLESVHFSCSDDSLDFGSPTAHSTQVEAVRRPVTRCRKSLSGAKNASIADNDSSDLKYLGIISQPVKSGTSSSDLIAIDQENKVETIDLTNVSSSDSCKDQVASRNADTDSSENSSVRYLGIVTQPSKEGADKSSQIKIHCSENLQNAYIMNSKVGQTTQGQVKKECETSDSSIVKQNAVENKLKNIAYSVSSSKGTTKTRFKSQDTAQQLSIEKQAESSSNFSSDKSVISPSPEADVSHFSPFSLTGNVSRLVSTRIRKSNPSNNTCDQSTSTADMIDDKSGLASLISKFTGQSISTAHTVNDNLETSIQVQIGYGTAENIKNYPAIDHTCDLVNNKSEEMHERGLTEEQSNVLESCMQTDLPEAERIKDKGNEGHIIGERSEISVYIENAETDDVRQIKEKNVSCENFKTRTAEQNSEGNTEESTHVSNLQAKRPRRKEQQLLISDNPLHKSQQVRHGNPSSNRIYSTRNKDTSVACNKRRQSERLLKAGSTDSKSKSKEIKRGTGKANGSLTVKNTTSQKISRNGKKQTPRKCKKSNRKENMISDNLEKSHKLDQNVRQMASSEDSSIDEDSDEALKLDLKSSENVNVKKALIEPTLGCKPKTVLQAEPSTKWEANFYEWAKEYEESGCVRTQCSECEDDSLPLGLENMSYVYEKSLLVDNENVLDSGENLINNKNSDYTDRMNSKIADMDKTSGRSILIAKAVTKSKDTQSKSVAERLHQNDIIVIDENCNEGDTNRSHSGWPAQLGTENANCLSRTSKSIKDKISCYSGIQADTSGKMDASCSSPKQIIEEESLGFETFGSPDLLTGTQPFDTENLRVQSPTQTVKMPDILTGTQPFDTVFTQTQSFVPNLSSTLRSVSDTSSELSPLNSENSKSDEIMYPKCLSAESNPLLYTAESRLSVESNCHKPGLKEQSIELNKENRRLEQLCQPVSNIVNNQTEFVEKESETRNVNKSQFKYKIFREKGKQKSDTYNQNITETQRPYASMVDLANSENETCRELVSSEPRDKLENRSTNASSNNIIVISSDSSQETVPDMNNGNNGASANCEFDKHKIIKTKATTYQSDKRFLQSSTFNRTISNKTDSELGIETIAPISDIDENTISCRTSLEAKRKARSSTILNTFQMLDLSSIRVSPVTRKKEANKRSYDGGKSDIVNKNCEPVDEILRVKPIHKKITRCMSKRENAVIECKVVSSESEVEPNFEMEKHQNIRTYEPKKMIIDGHEMGTINKWMNLVKSPYPFKGKYNQKEQSAEPKSNRDEVVTRKDVLVHKKIDGIFRFVREPVAQSSYTKTKFMSTSNKISESVSAKNKTFSDTACTFHKVPDESKVDSKTENKKNINAFPVEGVEPIKNCSGRNYTENTDKNVINLKETETSPLGIIQNKIIQTEKEKDNSQTLRATDCIRHEPFESECKRPNKRKLKEIRHEVKECKITKLNKSDTPQTTSNDLTTSHISACSKQTTIDSFFIDTEKQERKKKHLDALDLRNSFTQDWIEKQAFDIHSSSEESQKDNPHTQGLLKSVKNEDHSEGNEDQTDSTEREKVCSLLPVEEPSEIGKKLLEMTLPQNLKEQVTKILQE